jgi:hypothetical protein
LADGWNANFDGWNADFDADLRASRWRHGQTREQCCDTEKRFGSAHNVTPLFKVSAIAGTA